MIRIFGAGASSAMTSVPGRAPTVRLAKDEDDEDEDGAEARDQVELAADPGRRGRLRHFRQHTAESRDMSIDFSDYVACLDADEHEHAEALEACFTWDEAHLIASADYLVDKNRTTTAEKQPLKTHNKINWHAFGRNEERFNVLWERVLEEQDPNLEHKRLRLLELYSEVLGSVAKPYPGIETLVAELERRGIAWGISTNKPRAYTEPLLERVAIRPAPGSVVCPDDVKERKPHPESLYLNCRQLNCAPHEAIYVGDHQRDIEAGRRAGMYTIAAAYGYIEPHDDPRQWGANARADTSTDLPDLILS